MMLHITPGVSAAARGVGLMLVLGAQPGEALAASTSSYIQIENAKPGTTEWTLTNPGLISGIIEWYASLASVNRGGQIEFFVNTAEPLYTMDIFRMGYYGGLGGRRMLSPISRQGLVQPQPTMDPTTGFRVEEGAAAVGLPWPCPPFPAACACRSTMATATLLPHRPERAQLTHSVPQPGLPGTVRR
jgi:hypothetical protein